MSQITSLLNQTPAPDQSFGEKNSLNELNIDNFLELMIAELQNQDPLNPMENSELLQQISQIREVGATDKLTQTLESVLLGQNVSSATSLIGQEVRALTENGTNVTGIVDRVNIVDGVPKLNLASELSAINPSSTAGEIEAGTYRYKVVYEGQSGKPPLAVELGPLVTKGTEQTDQSIVLNNLPETTSRKLVYRTDASGEGPYHYVSAISGNASEFTDTNSQANLPGGVLQIATDPIVGQRTHTIRLTNVAEIRRQAAAPVEETDNP